MRNQPKYNFFKNTSYAIKGMKDVFKHETSFKIELLIGLALLPVLIFVDLELTQKLLMFTTMMGVAIAEVINSAIERTVDLVTLEHHAMAGRAKDVGSFIVFLSIFVFAVVWGLLLCQIF
jgi:diacylglycerol kinase (ATP)